MRYIIIAAIALLSLSSCKNLVPYSDAVKTKYNLNDDLLKHVQFYVSSPIVLQHKVVEGGNTQVSGGKIKVINGEKIEEIIIPSGTPGVMVRDDSGKLEISFEKGDDHFLRFGANPSRYEAYVLLASDWKGKIGTVTYAGNKYYTSPESADALLMIDLRKVANYQRDERVARGRKAN